MNENFFSIDKQLILTLTKAFLFVLLVLGILLFAIIVDENHIHLSSNYYYETLNSDHIRTIYAHWIVGFFSLCILNFEKNKISAIIFNIIFGIVISSNIYSTIYVMYSKDYRLTMVPIIFSFLSLLVLLTIKRIKLKNITNTKKILSIIIGLIFIPSILVFICDQEFDSIIKIHDIVNKKYHIE